MIKRKLFKILTKYSDAREALVITGMRQVGKTTLLRQMYDDVRTENKVFLDLENQLNQKMFETEDYESIMRNFQNYGIRSSERAYIFLDEIQFAPKLPSIVKYYIDNYRWKFFLTGSSSFYLKNLFSESLAGRKYLFELYPFDFDEFLLLKKVTGVRPLREEQISKTTFARWQPLYEEYVKWGGFPAVIQKESFLEKRLIIEDIFSSYFNKEILQLGDFRNNRSIRDLMLLLLSRTGSRIDMQKLSSEIGISRVTVKQYLSFLEGTYFISLIHPYTKNRDVEIRSAQKIYACDSGLVNILGDADFGHVFENAIFHQLRTQGTVHYYMKKSGAEIDFIVGEKHSFEVKTHAMNTDMARLKVLSSELGLTQSTLVSFSHTHISDAVYGFQL